MSARKDEHSSTRSDGTEVYYVVWETREGGPANFIIKMTERSGMSWNMTGGAPSFAEARADVRRLLMRRLAAIESV